MNPNEVRAMLGAYQSWAQSLCAPVFWRDVNGELHNGTMTFVRTPTDVLGVTNAHVADGITACSDEPGRGCQVGGAHLDPARLIARHSTMDLATFRLSDVLLAASGHQAASVLSWPPQAPSEGKPVMYGGYPAIYRGERDGNYDFLFAWFASTVQSSSEQNVGMVLQISTSNSVSSKRIPPNADLGGWS